MSIQDLKPEVQKAFREDDRKVRIQNSIAGCWLAITLMPAGMTLDYFVYPEHLWFFLKLRLFCSLMVGLILVLFYTPFGKRHYLVFGQLWYLLPAFFISWMIYASEGASSSYYAGLNIVLIAVGFMLPWTYQENLVSGILIMGMYLGACALQGPLTLKGDFFNNLYFLFLTDIIVVTGSFFSEKLRLSEYALRYELDQNKQILEESNRKLVELDQMKTQFFANVSHELRTPLTLLIAPLEELLRLSSLDASTREILKLMQGNAMRLLKLINDLLDLAKLDSGRVEVRKEPLAVAEFIQGLAQSVQGAAKDKKVRLSSNAAENLGTVLIDRDKLEKIIFNLLFNSVKFTPAGGAVELSALSQDGQLVLQVKDTGMGISEKDLPHIFDRFWQADASAQRKYQGTGIGLSLVKELVEVQGGRVSVESQAGKGTTMTVRIPLEKTSEATVAQPTVPEGGTIVSGTGSPAESDEWLAKLYRRAELFPALTPLAETLKRDEYGKGKRPRVLIADDEPDMLRFLKSQLEKYYDVIEAVDGNQAVEKARQFLPDLILLDMMMPQKDGIQACRELRGLVSTQTIPVVLLTARADDETKMAALQAGAGDFLTKPFSTTELYVRVKNLIESHQFQRELARQKTALESALEQLKETEGQLVQSEKMASLGRLSAGIIHEINNPLNYASQALYLLKTKKDKMPEGDREKYVEILSDIEEGVGRVQKIVSDLRSFSHPHIGGAVDLIRLEESVSAALRFLSHEVKDRVKVHVEVPKEESVLADRNKLILVFVNLIQNSVDALKEKKFEGEEPSVWIQSRRENGKVLIQVKDNGMGIEAENLGKVFDPFFTTKDVGEGMGLGLSLCYRMMVEQGGGISVRSEKGKFTEFTLEMPAGN